MQTNDFIIVTFSAKIKETNQEFDKAENTSVIVGIGYTIKGLDEALKEMNIGEKKTIEIPPEKGFGERKVNLIKLITISEFRRHGTKPKPGMIVDADNMRGRVLSASGGRVRVDFNHPLAGKTLVYELEIKQKIEKPEEKIKAIVEIFTKVKKASVTISEKKANINVPPVISPVFKKKIADDVMKFLNMEKVNFIETFEKPKEEPKEK